MQRLLLSIILFVLAFFSPAQEIRWANNITAPHQDMSFAVDEQSNLYLYGYTERSNPSPIEGSEIRKFDPSGDLLKTVRWQSRFYLSTLLPDGKGNIFFCGFFRGQVKENGVSLNATGGTDGFFGLMDDNCNVRWVIGFGGAKDDKARTLCFNSDTSEIVIAGGIDSTLMLYGYPMITTPAAIFVARFNLQGGLASYRTYAFAPGDDGHNMGYEIERNDDGYYLLASRKGDHWGNMPPETGPEEGFYMFNLDESLEIRWSRFIISSSCYYGYSVGRISVHMGQVCVPSFCSGKYGGTGLLNKLEALSGASTWSITNRDGRYYDTYSAGNMLYYVGNEEANGCPCEDNNPGFARVKVLDSHDGDRVLLSKFGFRFQQVIAAPNGNIYVAGHTGGPDPHLQEHALQEGYFLFAMQSPPPAFRISPRENDLLGVVPNPSEGYTEISCRRMMEMVSVIGPDGSLVREIRPNAKSCTLRDLPRGLYIVRAKHADGYSHGRVLVK